jgi:hypothetical protein
MHNVITLVKLIVFFPTINLAWLLADIDLERIYLCVGIYKND